MRPDGSGGSGAGPSAWSPASRPRRSSTCAHRREPPPTSTRSSRVTSRCSPGWARSGCCAAARGPTRFPARKTGRNGQRSACRQAVPRWTSPDSATPFSRTSRRASASFGGSFGRSTTPAASACGSTSCASAARRTRRCSPAGRPAATTPSPSATCCHAAADGGGERFDLTFSAHVVPFAYPAYGDRRRERRRRRPVLETRAA